MLKKVMSKFGIGSATIDLILANDRFRAGETITGYIHLHGGTVDQHINRLTVDLCLQVHYKGIAYTKVIETIQIRDAFTLNLHEKVKLPFTYRLSNDFMASTPYVRYFFKTHLDIASGIDSHDHDDVAIEPHEAIKHVVTALGELHFSEAKKSRTFDGYTQHFIFAPPQQSDDPLQALGTTFGFEGDRLHVLLEVTMPEETLVHTLHLPFSTTEKVWRSKLSYTLEQMMTTPHLYRSTRFTHAYSPKYKASLVPNSLGTFATSLFVRKKLGEQLQDIAQTGLETLGFERNEPFNLREED